MKHQNNLRFFLFPHFNIHIYRKPVSSDTIYTQADNGQSETISSRGLRTIQQYRGNVTGHKAHIPYQAAKSVLAQAEGQLANSISKNIEEC